MLSENIVYFSITFAHGRGASGGARSLPLKIPKKLCVVLFPSTWGLFSMWGGGFFSFYVKIYLDMSPLTKISAGVHASAAKVVPNILEHRVI